MRFVPKEGDRVGKSRKKKEKEKEKEKTKENKERRKEERGKENTPHRTMGQSPRTFPHPEAEPVGQFWRLLLKVRTLSCSTVAWTISLRNFGCDLLSNLMTNKPKSECSDRNGPQTVWMPSLRIHPLSIAWFHPVPEESPQHHHG